MAAKVDWEDGDEVDAAAMNALGTETNLKAPSASPAFTGTPTGLTKSHVGLGNVDNTADATKNSAAVTLTNKTIDVDNNTVSNIEVDNFKGSALVTESEGLASSDNDTSIPTTAAVRKYVDIILPATVPANRSRPHFYDPSRNVYNYKGSNTRKLRASLARAANGGLRHWAMVGDSIMGGYMGDGASPDWEPTKAYPRIMRSYLAAQGIPVGGTGFVPTCDAIVAVTDSRWSKTGTWTVGGSARVLVTTQNGATATFTSDTPGTQVDVYYHGTSTGGTVTIDGGSPVALTLTGSVPAKYTVTGLPNTTHTVVITSTSTLLAVSGASVTNTSGLVVHNLAQGSTGSGTWADTSDQLLNDVRVGSLTLSGITPDVVFIELGGNDWLNSVTGATFKTNMTTLRNQFSASDVVLVQIPTWSHLLEEMYDLADSLDVPLVDWFDRYGGSTPLTANGLMTDAASIHTNQAWHLDAGRNLGLLVAS